MEKVTNSKSIYTLLIYLLFEEVFFRNMTIFNLWFHTKYARELSTDRYKFERNKITYKLFTSNM
jgi:hypothetical protein